MSKTDKILTSEYLDWHAKLSGLLSVLTKDGTQNWSVKSEIFRIFSLESDINPKFRNSKFRICVMIQNREYLGI